ncbi:hypothetical protein Gorai_014488, partial [Gossypium raimondii]|nr:hypothetical protein [Gossypium raimondii]
MRISPLLVTVLRRPSACLTSFLSSKLSGFGDLRTKWRII